MQHASSEVNNASAQNEITMCEQEMKRTAAFGTDRKLEVSYKLPVKSFLVLVLETVLECLYRHYQDSWQTVLKNIAIVNCSLLLVSCEYMPSQCSNVPAQQRLQAYERKLTRKLVRK